MNQFLINEGVQIQRKNESIRYKLTTTPWASAPTSVDVEVWDITNPNAEADVTSTTITGSSIITDDIITLPNLHSLIENHKYRMDVSFQSGGNTLVVPILIKGIR